MNQPLPRINLGPTPEERARADEEKARADVERAQAERLRLENEAKRRELDKQKNATTAPVATRTSAVTENNQSSIALPGGTMESLIHQCDDRRPVNPENAMEYGQCRGFISGVFVLLGLMRQLEKKDAVQICLPQENGGISVDQEIKIFQKWASDHPEKLHESALAHIIIAFTQAFPCPVTAK